MASDITLDDIRQGRFIPPRVRIVCGRDGYAGPGAYRFGFVWRLPLDMSEIREGDLLYSRELSIALRVRRY